MLVAVPNVSEGRDTNILEAIAEAFGPGVIDVSADPDHHRAVFTITGNPGELAHRVLAGARATIERVDITTHEGVHPRVGAIDVAPIVHLDEHTRGAACAEALVLADLLATELDLPVFLYGPLADDRTRAELRRGGPEGLGQRIAEGLKPDFGPHHLHPTAGAVLVAARPPLVAFNVEIDADLQTARRIAAAIRHGGPEGLPGVRALGLQTAHAVQVSTNVEDYTRATPADVVRAVARHARVTGAELVAPAPRAAFAEFPETPAVRGLRFLP